MSNDLESLKKALASIPQEFNSANTKVQEESISYIKKVEIPIESSSTETSIPIDMSQNTTETSAQTTNYLTQQKIIVKMYRLKK